MTVSVQDLKSKLTELLVKVEGGETIVIERHGKPIVRIERVAENRSPRYGTMRDRIRINDPNWANPQTEDEWLAGE